MRTIIITSIFIIASFGVCQAQQIEIEKVFGGYKFVQDGEQLKMGELVSTMETNQEAFELIKKAQSKYSLTTVIGAVGGGLIGWPVGTAIGGGYPNWTLAAVGVGVIAIGIPIQLNANKYSKEAVKLYNMSYNTASYREFSPEFKIVMNGTGLGISMSF